MTATKRTKAAKATMTMSDGQVVDVVRVCVVTDVRLNDMRVRDNAPVTPACAPEQHRPNYCHADYLKHVIRADEIARRIPLAVERLHELGWQFDAVAFRGLSGALAAPIIAYLMHKTIIAVRKPYEVDNHAGHSNRPVDGDRGARRYVVVDDFVATGDTLRAIKRAISDWAPRAECVGILEIAYIHHRLAARGQR